MPGIDSRNIATDRSVVRDGDCLRSLVDCSRRFQMAEARENCVPGGIARIDRGSDTRPVTVRDSGFDPREGITGTVVWYRDSGSVPIAPCPDADPC